MSHDCDCDSCQQTDSRWAPHRETQRALKEDCPRGVHVADLWRATVGVKESAEYKCKHCRVWVDSNGKRTVKTLRDETEEILDRMSRAAKAPVCPTHKRYQAKRKPRVNCEGCWRRYIAINHPLPFEHLDKLEKALDACKACGTTGAHYCTGKKSNAGIDDDLRLCTCGQPGCYMCGDD